MTDCYYVANQGVSADLRIPVCQSLRSRTSPCLITTLLLTAHGALPSSSHTMISSETSIFNRMEAFNGVWKHPCIPISRDFQVDHENFIAKVDLEAYSSAMQATGIILDSRPFTVVLTKTGTAFTGAGWYRIFYPQGRTLQTKCHSFQNKSFLGLSGLKATSSPWKNTTGISPKWGRARQDFHEPQIETDFYRHFAYDIKTEKLYMETVVNGQPSAQRAALPWSDDGSRIITAGGGNIGAEDS